MSDLEEERRLRAAYAEYSDGELLRLAAEMEDLTEMAQGVLRSELTGRRLNVEVTPVVGARSEAEVASLFPTCVSELASGDCVWEFAEWEDARAAGEMLEEAGIAYELTLPSSTRSLDMTAPRLAVMAEDAERAREVLSKSLPEESRTPATAEAEFVPPTCPTCGAEDPLLEAFEPVNQWRCAMCGAIWVEPATE